MRLGARLLAMALAVGAPGVGCDATADPAGEEGALTACDPFDAEQAPIELGELIAAGRGADDRVYVLTEGTQGEDGELRVFVSDDKGVLQRERVLGTGSSNEPGRSFEQASVDADPPFTLFVDTNAREDVVLVKLAGTERVDPNDLSAGETLTLLSEDELAEFGLRNLTAETAVEYFGALADGRRVLVVRPADDFSYDDFRVFLGTPERMIERDVDEVARARDGGSTTITLTIDGAAATLSFPIESTPDGDFEPGPASLKQAGTSTAIDLEEEPDASAADDLDFFCS